MNLREAMAAGPLKDTLDLTFASVLSSPDGTHQIENGGIEYTPKLTIGELIVFCNQHANKYREYRIKSAAFFNADRVRIEQRVPPIDKFWE